MSVDYDISDESYIVIPYCFTEEEWEEIEWSE
jgi:hypothetical protein